MGDAALYLQGRAAWPTISVTEGAFQAAARIASAATDGSEIYLACACAAGDTAAIDAFETRYFACVPAVVRRLRLPDDDAQEVAQTLRKRLFVGGPEQAGVLRYAGTGSLGGLVQVAATRIAIDLRRGRERIAADEPSDTADTTTSSPEDTYSKEEYRDRIKSAIEDAAASLSPRDRTLLRLHLVDRSSIDDIAALYRVHRATAARWVSAAREELFDHTREHFLAATQLEDAGGLASFVESQLTLSLSRILRD